MVIEIFIFFIEPESNTNKSLLDLPTFFSDCHFLLYGDFDASDTKLIKRYITAYSGSVYTVQCVNRYTCACTIQPIGIYMYTY